MSCHPDGYDAKQAAAVLLRCEGCGHTYYMTRPADRCLACSAQSMKGSVTK